MDSLFLGVSMLFLAVFCGFLAEYQLESKIEKDREKQFIRSMLEDLKRDTFQLSFQGESGQEERIHATH